MNALELNLLRPLWIDKSFTDSEKFFDPLKTWLIDGNYYVNNLQPVFSLYAQIDNELKGALSIDAFRFATHSAQTVFEIECSKAYPNFTAWRLIQTYYASFFSAHAILRFFGKSFSHLETGHVKFLNKRCSTEAGYDPKLSSGYYLMSFKEKENNIDFFKYDESHKDLWKCFHALIQDISSELLKGIASKDRRETLSKFFSDIADALTARGRFPAGNWLSVVRNDVNYKSSHGVWFPFSKKNPSFEYMMNKIGDWRKRETIFESPSLIRNEIERFISTSFIIIDICLSICFDYQKLAGTAGKRSSSFSKLISQSAAA
ncbi:hypothetical protein [Sphingomonas sp. Marseille-Q8236]